MNLVDNFIDFREQIEQHNFYHIVVFNWVLIKSLIGSNFFVSPAPMITLLSLYLFNKILDFTDLLQYIDFIKEDDIKIVMIKLW